MKGNTVIIVDGKPIKYFVEEESDYINITDIAKCFPVGVSAIESWMRNRNTIEFLGTWERLYNDDFNSDGFDGIKANVGLNSFKVSAKNWIAATNAIGIRAKAGRYGGTFAHKDIAMQFGYYLSPKFQLYLIKEFQRIKEVEAKRKNLKWEVHRIISKTNFQIHTEAIKKHLIPPRIKNTRDESLVYASEADRLNVALFGMTAKQWRSQNPDMEGNLRDTASTEQLIVLSNLQSLNTKLMEWGSDGDQRLEIMNKMAIEQMEILTMSATIQQLPGQDKQLKSGEEENDVEDAEIIE